MTCTKCSQSERAENSVLTVGHNCSFQNKTAQLSPGQSVENIRLNGHIPPCPDCCLDQSRKMVANSRENPHETIHEQVLADSVVSVQSLDDISGSSQVAIPLDPCPDDVPGSNDVQADGDRPLAQSDEDRPKGSRRSHLGSNKKGLPQNLKFSFLCLIICVILISLVLVLYLDTMSPIVERIASKFGYQNEQYAVIFDAGSTGSRVLAYKFHRSILDNKLILDEELFKERKPGLSSFVDNPEQGAHSIKLLLDEARSFIPRKKWHETPIVLKATAGLRLLPPVKAKNILNAVRDLFAKSEFIVDADAVEIMDGTDEGIFSWFTVNFLLGLLSKSNQAAALDLGGASTQVTFALSDPEQIPIFEKFIHPVRASNKEINVFTHSYLGLGLMAIRHQVFTGKLPKNETLIESECVNPIVRNKSWTYANTEYIVSGKDHPKSSLENPVVDFDLCLDRIKSIVIPLVKPKPITLKQHAVAAFSYYFERAIETGLVDPVQGGEISVEDYRKKAQEVCANANTEQPFMCLDLSFISVLLHEGYGLENKKKIKLYKKIDGHEISWALGCAYNVLTSTEKNV